MICAIEKFMIGWYNRKKLTLNKSIEDWEAMKMTEQEFMMKATEIIKQMVNAVADKEYEKLASFMCLDPSWLNERQSLTEAFEEFGRWIDIQLEGWEEDEGRKFVIDHFNEDCMETPDFSCLEKQNFTMTTYQPTNEGENIDFWFEIGFIIENNEKLIAELNINF